jgi:hypothetical protein
VIKYKGSTGEVDALGALLVKTAYLAGELCALVPDGVPTFSRL